MFIIDLTFKVPLATIDLHLDSHLEFLNEQYQQGIFLASGRKEPRTGGIILAQISDKNELLKIMEKDPFVIHDLVDCSFTEFVASKTCEELKFLML